VATPSSNAHNKILFIIALLTIPNDQTQKVVVVYRCFLIFRWLK
jgi:hypothetical protein